MNLAELRDYANSFIGHSDNHFMYVSKREIERLLDLADAAVNECFQEGTGYRRTHISDELHRCVKAVLEGT